MASGTILCISENRAGRERVNTRDVPVIARRDETRTLLVTLVMLRGFDNELEVVHGGVKQHLSLGVGLRHSYINVSRPRHG